MNIHAFLVTSLAGISTILGFFVIWMKKEDSVLPSALGFSAGVMLFVSLLDLIPSALSYFRSSFLPGFHLLFCLLFINIGILLSLTIHEKLSWKAKGDSLYQIGFLSMVAIMLHNIPEGIITYVTTSLEFKTGLFLSLSIACHNIPEGICIAVPIYYSTGSKKQAFKMVVLSALSEPIGAILAALFLEDRISNSLLGILLAIVSGIMISLSITEIIPESFRYSIKKTVWYIGIGFFFLLFTHLLFS